MKGYARQLKAILAEHDCYFVRRGKGDHDMWWSPKTQRNFPVDNVCKSRHTANAVLKQAGIQQKI